jgi:hypothetical protein
MDNFDFAQVLVDSVFHVLRTMWPLFLLIIGGGIVIGLLTRFTRKFFNQSPNNKNIDSSEPDNESTSPYLLPYQKKEYIFSSAEFRFYKALREHLDHQYAICPKMRLLDIFHLPKDTKRYQVHFNKIARKHVDFVICHSNSMSPICAIELDDSSHRRAKGIERDNFINSVYNSAHFPLIHYIVANSYTRDDILIPLKPHIRSLDHANT